MRPPAIYGPGDMEMLELFKLAKRGLALLPPGGRLSVIDVGDLGRLLLALAPGQMARQLDATTATRMAGATRNSRAIGTAVGKRVSTFALPRPLLMAGAHLDRLVRGKGAKLTPDRVAYFCHQDWVRRRPAPAREFVEAAGGDQCRAGGDRGLVSRSGPALSGPFERMAA